MGVLDILAVVDITAFHSGQYIGCVHLGAGFDLYTSLFEARAAVIDLGEVGSKTAENQIFPGQRFLGDVRCTHGEAAIMRIALKFHGELLAASFPGADTRGPELELAFFRIGLLPEVFEVPISAELRPVFGNSVAVTGLGDGQNEGVAIGNGALGHTGDLNRDRRLFYGYRNANAGNCMVVRIAGRVGCLKGMLAHAAHTLCAILPGPAGGQRDICQRLAVLGGQAGGDSVGRCGLCNAILHAGGHITYGDAGGILAHVSRGGAKGGVALFVGDGGCGHIGNGACHLGGFSIAVIGQVIRRCDGVAAAVPVQRAAVRRALGGDGRTVRRVAPAVPVQAEGETVTILADHVLAAVVAGEDGAIVQVRVGRPGSKLLLGSPGRYVLVAQAHADAGILRQALIDGDGYIFA